MSKNQPKKLGRKKSVPIKSQLSPALSKNTFETKNKKSDARTKKGELSSSNNPDMGDHSNPFTLETSVDSTPSKYNGGQLDSLPLDGFSFDDLIYNHHLSEATTNRPPLSYVVGIDWAELSLRGDLSYLYKTDLYEKKHFKISRLDIRTKHFNHAFNVYFHDTLLGSLLCGPRSSVIPIELVQFKIDNQYFYKDALPQKLSHVIKLFLDAFELTFNNFTRLDIYIDFHKFNDELTFGKFVSLYASGEIETKGKITKWNPFYSKKDGKMNLTGFSMGSRSSEKYLRCYNKTLEIVESHKDYIKAFWESNGMDISKDIFRFELQLNSKFFSSLKIFRDFEDGMGNILSEESLNKLLSLKPSTVISLFDCGLRNYFDFFIQESKSRNDDKLPFIVFDWAVLLERIKTSTKNGYKFVKQRIRHKQFTWRQKMIVARNLFREYIYSKQNNEWLKPLVKIIMDYNLSDRWNKRREFYIKEFMQLSPLFYLFDELAYNAAYAMCTLEIKKKNSEVTQLQLIDLPVIPLRQVYSTQSAYYVLTGKTVRDLNIKNDEVPF